MVNPSPAISRYDVWFPKDPEQRVLWPTTLTLSQEFFTSLQAANAVPLDGRAVSALQHSAMALDVYTWLAHRLRRIPVNKPAIISWQALKISLDLSTALKGSFARISNGLSLRCCKSTLRPKWRWTSGIL